MHSPISPDTETTLLLCTRMGEPAGGIKPLTARSFSALVNGLGQRGLRLGDLLDLARRAQLPELQLAGVTCETVEALLNRTAALAVAAGEWSRRGVWVISGGDADYPERLGNYLGHRAPPLLFGVGPAERLRQGGLAMVGSREATADELEFSRRVATACAGQGITVVSGAARGIDLEAMTAALDAGGEVAGVLAEGLCRSAVVDRLRNGRHGERVVLVSPFDPDSRWFAGAAMERNKLIYGLADAALVVSAAADEGGTWAGAVEALKRDRIPIYARAGEAAPTGNRKLIESGARPFPAEPWEDLRELWSAAELPRSLF